MNEKIIGTLLALSPIAHNGNEKSGNTVTLRRVYMITSNGKRKSIPYFEGNALRGMLRRLLVKNFFDTLKMDNLEPRVYHMFFTGGNLEQVTRGQGEIDIALRRKIQEFLPPIALLGTSYLNQAIPGKLIVGKVYPVCKELEHFFSMFGYKKEQEVLFNVEQLTGETFQTRKDNRNVKKVDAKNPMQMKIETEVFIPGTVFMHYFILSDCSQVESSMFHHVINLWKQRPHIGGKSGIGNGQVKIQYDLSKLPVPEIYLDFIKDNKPRIVNLIREIEQDAVTRTKKKKKTKGKNLSEFSK